MFVTLLFLTQLLCAMVPCDPKFDDPEISRINVVDVGSSGNARASRAFSIEEDDNENEETSSSEILNRNNNTIVQISTGAVIGFKMQSMNGRTIHTFEGIPYAEPPVGQNRFRPPIPKQRWTGIFPATKRGHPCLQISPVKLYRTFGREDCLTVNVYSSKLPRRSASPNLPVLVWIHGGAYLFGEGADYGPSYLLNKPLVLVSMNYRLGILGFLSTSDNASPGNNGLKDQALALQWVHENIAKFGGDPNRVTLIGHSAGGSSAHFHMMNTNSSAHFQSAISLSGTGMNHWALSDAATSAKYANKIARSVNCPILVKGNVRRSFELVDCLRSKNPNTLVSRQFRLLEWGPFPLVLFAPVIEVPNESAILTQHPSTMYAQDKVAKMPWIASFTKEEGLFQLLLVYGHLKIPELRSQWTKAAPHALDIANAKNPNEIVRKVREFYFQDKPLKNISYARLSDPITDRFFVNGIHDGLVAHSAIAPTYGYMFDFLGKHNVGNYLGLDAKEWGIGHTEDVFYIFNSSTTYNGFSKKDAMELELSQIIVNLIHNFASKRIPVYTDASGVDQAIWTPVDASNPYFLQIGQVTKMISDPFMERRKFWENINI